jgi:peptidoglycan hydrolase-like protein with peptidoglycan-binding domain
MNRTTMRRRVRGCAANAGLAALLIPVAADARLGDSTLKVGDRGRDVLIAQKLLTRSGISTTADGVYGRATAARVRRFERAGNLPVDGKLQPADVSALKAAAKRGAGTTGDDGSGSGAGAGAGGEAANGGAAPGQAPASSNGAQAQISADGRTAVAPENAPPQVKQAIAAANRITDKPYKYGGGHGNFEDSGYDCSGAVSYALHGAGLLDEPLDSSGLMSWGEPGKGEWITVYAHSSHAFVVIAGVRFDTSGDGEKGPRWRQEARSGSGYTIRHPQGL